MPYTLLADEPDFARQEYPVPVFHILTIFQPLKSPFLAKQPQTIKIITFLKSKSKMGYIQKQLQTGTFREIVSDYN